MPVRNPRCSKRRLAGEEKGRDRVNRSLRGIVSLPNEPSFRETSVYRNMSICKTAIYPFFQTALHWGAKHGDENIIKLIAGAHKDHSKSVNKTTVRIGKFVQSEGVFRVDGKLFWNRYYSYRILRINLWSPSSEKCPPNPHIYYFEGCFWR